MWRRGGAHGGTSCVLQLAQSGAPDRAGAVEQSLAGRQADSRSYGRRKTKGEERDFGFATFPPPSVYTDSNTKNWLLSEMRDPRTLKHYQWLLSQRAIGTEHCYHASKLAYLALWANGAASAETQPAPKNRHFFRFQNKKNVGYFMPIACSNLYSNLGKNFSLLNPSYNQERAEDKCKAAASLW